jgi:hypothetical protein
MSELLWVAVPNGFVSPAAPTLSPTTAVIRVLIVPRLAAGMLADFGLQQWPDQLADLSILVRTRDGANGTVATHSPLVTNTGRSEIWDAFFSGDAGLINDYVPVTHPAPTVAPTSGDATNAHLTHRNVTRALAANPTAPGANLDPDKVVRDHLADWAQPEPASPPADTTALPSIGPDFHSTVSTLREHPNVLLDLGLIIELRLDVTALSEATAGTDPQLQVVCEDLPAGFVVSPWTRYDLDAQNFVFRPAPAPGSSAGIRHGVVDLSDCTNIFDVKQLPDPSQTPARWLLTTFDVNGIVGNLRQTARDLQNNATVPATMPPMRSAGLALLRPDRQAELTARTQTAAINAAAPMTGAVLSADDLVLGYRVDIQRHVGTQWRSVCERDARYTVNDNLIIGGTSGDGFTREEGHVKPFSAVRDGDGGLNTDEVVVRWDGWSLAIPTPNLRGDTSGSTSTSKSNQIPYQFAWEYQIPTGRLPALRFSNTYQMRVRVRDIAGGGVELDGAELDHLNHPPASAPIIYRRHEPVPPPRLGPIQPPQKPTDIITFAVGAALDRLVVRSDKTLTPEQLHALDPDYPLLEIRALDTPTASLQLIELHGLFDDKDLTDAQAFQWVQRAMRADGTDTSLPTGLPDPVASAIVAVETAQKLTATEAWNRLPHTQAEASWPDLPTKLIRLVAAPDPTTPLTFEWVDDTKDGTSSGPPIRALQVTLGKAQQATLLLSSTVADGMEDHLAVYSYLDVDNAPAGTDAATTGGLNPVISPPRAVTFVHAVKRPLADPAWNQPLPILRSPGDFNALLNAEFTEVATGQGLHTGSTGHIDIAATWQEFDDTGPQTTGPRTVTVEHLDGRDLTLSDPPPKPRDTSASPPQSGDTTAFPVRHEFGDTKHRQVTYTLNATSRFRPYFKPDEPDESFHASLTQPAVNIPSTVRPPAPVVLSVVPAFAWQRTQPAPDRIERIRGGQRLRVELARPWFVTGEGEQLAVVLGTAADLVTRIGRDPLFATPPTPLHPTADWFSTTATATVHLPELNADVTVVPFDVTPGGDRWLADILFALPANAQSYNPFVSLAVARYQPSTLSTVAAVVSPVVIAEQVPLLPDRHVVINRNTDQLTITVDGISPTPANSFEAILETCDPGTDPASIDLTTDDPAGQAGIPAWRPIPGNSVTRGNDGTIPPLTLPATPGPLRLRLRETENLPLRPGTDAVPDDLAHRTVFVDTIVLPDAWRP